MHEKRERRSKLKVLEKEDLYEILDSTSLEKLSKEQRRIVVRSLCYYDKEYFAKNITRRWTSDKASGVRYEIPDFHRQLLELSSSGEDVLCIIPRGFAKTTIVSKIGVLWDLLFEEEQSIILIMTKGLGEDVIGDIRFELETNPLIRWIWGDLVPISNKAEKTNEKWRQRQLDLLNGCGVKTLTKGESIRGSRPTKVIIDDPQENKDVKNPLMADEFYNWIFTSVYGAINPDEGSMIVLGTVIGNNCFVNKLKQNAGHQDFKVFEFPAILEFDEEKFTGKPLWPVRWSLEKLYKRFRKGKKAFMQEYMNIPLILNGSPVFDEEIPFLVKRKPLSVESGVNWFVSREERKDLHVIIGGDLALGGTDGDNTSFTGRTLDGKLVFHYKGHITQDRMAALLDSVIIQFKSIYLVPENNNASAFIIATKQYSWRPYMYKQKVMDKVVMKDQDKYGFNTNASTKPILIMDFRKFIRASGAFEVPEDEYEELCYFYYNEQGGMEAISPYHDDTVISDALCIQGIVRGAAKVDVYI
mgnify:FL=1